LIPLEPILIRGIPRGIEGCGVDKTSPTKPMNDLLYIGITVAFFLANACYAEFCGKL
jgi:hypothetical protein